MHSIRWKLIVIYLALVFIVMIVSGTFILVSIRTQEENKSREALSAYADYINEQIINEYPEEKFQEGFLQSRFNTGHGGTLIQGNIINVYGETIVSTAEPTRYVRSIIIAAMDGRESFDAWAKNTDSSEQRKTWMELAVPVFDKDDELRYIIFVREDAQQIITSFTDITVTIVVSVALALTLTVVLGMLFASTITGPIINLTQKSKELASGKLQLELPVRSRDEIGELTKSFNQMARELRTIMKNIESEKNKLEIVLHYMTDGVLAYDNEGALIHANHESRALLSNIDPNETPFDEMCKILKLSIDSKTESTMLTEEKYISSNLTAYKNSNGQIEGIVIVLHDITKHKTLDNLRKEFVANVSHELRTPLTTIKSYTETLLDGAIEQKGIAEEFLSIIDGETDRMTYLVKDLLDLSQLDNKSYTMDMQEVNLVDLIRNSIMQNKVLAEMKSQEIRFEPQIDIMIVEVQPSRINQVFSNILSNAIKYSHENGIIEIIAEETERYYRVYVRDNGIGIPKEDLPRIFERFYRVDKARSRAMGGTGLGLAIVKQIMEAHGGKISVLSEQGDGTTMILRFNKGIF